MDKITTCDALADFDRWHAAEMRRINARGQKLRGVTLGVAGLLLSLLAAACLV